MFNKSLIALGCSLTHLPGWATVVSDTMDLKLINLSQAAGSNQLQEKRLQQFLLINDISKYDIVVWQITSTVRGYSRKRFYNSSNDDHNPNCTSMFENIFDGEKRIDLLSIAPDVIKDSDESQLLENLLFHLKVVKKYTPNLLVFLGWEQSISDNYREKFFSALVKNKIDYINEYMCEWCILKNYKMDSYLHPSYDGYEAYANEIIIPKLRQMIRSYND